MIPIEPIPYHARKVRKIKIYTTFRKSPFSFEGFHREDLDAEHPNWHYYQTYWKILPFRKEHILAVVEDFDV